jgi:hypothetical protein
MRAFEFRIDMRKPPDPYHPRVRDPPWRRGSLFCRPWGIFTLFYYRRNLAWTRYSLY